MLERHCDGSAAAKGELQAGGWVQQQSIDCKMVCMEPEPVPSYTIDDTIRIETLSPVFNWASSKMALFIDDIERYVRSVVVQLH